MRNWLSLLWMYVLVIVSPITKWLKRTMQLYSFDYPCLDSLNERTDSMVACEKTFRESLSAEHQSAFDKLKAAGFDINTIMAILAFIASHGGDLMTLVQKFIDIFKPTPAPTK